MSYDSRERRRNLRAESRDLYNRVSAILFRLDPIGINFETNTDEYDDEAGLIVPSLRGSTSVEALRSVVHSVFALMFTSNVAGPEARYQRVAEELWALRDSFDDSKT